MAQAVAMDDIDRIELSKENLQPLKRGRNPVILKSALGERAVGGGECSTGKGEDSILEQKRRWEEQLEKYGGDDPLDLWYKYVNWTEQAFPTGVATELRGILESATQGLQQHPRFPRYKEDIRYLTLWIKYADLFKDPDDIFRFLKENEIGQEHHLFYLAYAVVSEKRHNFSRATELYELGINRNVHGASKLKQKQQEFKARMEARIQRQQEEEALGMGRGGRSESARGTAADENGRQSLQALNPSRRAGGRAASRMSRHLPQSQQSSATLQAAGQQGSSGNVASGGLEIYVDDDLSAGVNPNPSGVQWNHLGAHDAVRKENTQAATSWAGVKMPTSKRSRAGGASGAASSLDIFVDQEFENIEPNDGKHASSSRASLRQRLDAVDPKFTDKPLLICTPTPSKSSGAFGSAVFATPASQTHVKGRGFDPKLLTDADGEESCFEEHRAKHWELARPVSPKADPAPRIEAAAEDAPPAVHPPAADPVFAEALNVYSDLSTDPSQQMVGAATNASTPADACAAPVEHQAAEDTFPDNQELPASQVESAVPDCTINTRLACEDIMSMFSDDLPCESTASRRRGRQRAAPSSSSGLQIFSDDPVLETAPPSLEIYSEFDQRTSSAAEPAGLDVYKDELDENAVPAPPPRLGVHREPLGSSDMATSDLQVWEDSDATAPASMDQSSVDPFAQADGLDLYRDDEFRTENLGQHVLAASSAEFARSEPEGEYPSDKENDVHPELAATRAPASMVVDEARALQPLPTERYDELGVEVPEDPEWDNYVAYAENTLRNAASSVMERAGQETTEIPEGLRGMVLEAFTDELMEGMIASEGVALADLEGVFFHGDGPAPAEVRNTVSSCKLRPRKDPNLRAMPLKLGESTYLLKGTAGRGERAAVFEAYPLMDQEDLDTADDDGNVFALKCETPAQPWEYVVMHRLASRLPEEAQPMFLNAHRMHLFGDHSMLLTDFGEYGTLQDALRKYAEAGQEMEEVVALFYTIELLSAVEAMHAAGLTHNGLGIENIMLRNGGSEWEEWAPWKPGSWQEKGLMLVDFDQAIDMRAFPKGTQFTGATRTESALCNEMLEGGPWTYHSDLYAVCGVVHCLMHGKPLELSSIETDAGGRRNQPQEPVKRGWQADLWNKLFYELLNLPSLDRPYDLETLRLAFEEYLVDHTDKMRDLKLFLMKQTIMIFSS